MNSLRILALMEWAGILEAGSVNTYNSCPFAVIAKKKNTQKQTLFMMRS